MEFVNELLQGEHADIDVKVHFPDDEPTYDGANSVVRLVAQVGGPTVVCVITAEALEDHFGAESTLVR